MKEFSLTLPVQERQLIINAIWEMPLKSYLAIHQKIVDADARSISPDVTLVDSKDLWDDSSQTSKE